MEIEVTQPHEVYISLLASVGPEMSSHEIKASTVILLSVLLACTFQQSWCCKESSLTPQLPAEEGPMTQLSAEWRLWKDDYGKHYASVQEELYRHVIWQSHQKFIDSHNHFNQTFGFTLAMNEMGDLVSA